MTTPRSVDLNADIGEGCPWDELLLGRVSSASIACGAHAGDRSSMLAALRVAAERGVAVGAHPGFDDRPNFGRLERPATALQVEHLVREQVGVLVGLAAEVEVAVGYIKPHGALYNQGQRDDAIAAGLVDAAVVLGRPILGLPGGRVEARAARAGVRFVGEGFADRRYRPDGTLVPRNEPGAILDDPGEIRDQLARLLDLGVATICIHGDDPRSVALAGVVRDELLRSNVNVTGFLR